MPSSNSKSPDGSFTNSKGKKGKTESCKKPNEEQHPLNPLVSYSDVRSDDKESLAKYIFTASYRVPLIKIVRDVFGYDNTDSIDGSNKDYQFARRFYTNNSDYFSVTKQNGKSAVTYTPEFIDLISQGITQESDVQNDREFCLDLLGSVFSVSPQARQFLSESVRSYVERIEDYYVFLRTRDGFREIHSYEYVRIPYRTRFNDVGRMKKQWAKLQQGLEFAGRAYCTPHDGDEYVRDTSERCWIDQNKGAAFLTLTTDPKQHDSLLDAIESLSDSVNMLMEWLSTQPSTLGDGRERWEGRLPYIKVLEFSGSEDSEYHGLPHVHILFFDVPTRDDGMPYLVDKDALSDYWSENCGQGEIVDIHPLVYRKSLPESYDADSGLVSYYDHYDGDGIDNKQTAGQYVGKYLSTIYGGILNLLDSDEEAINYDETAEAWKVGMYWATEKKVMSMSRGLEETVTVDDQQELSISQLDFVGVYHIDDVPTEMLRDSIPLVDYILLEHQNQTRLQDSRDRPPPGEEG
jgi:hypothetical protein